MRYLLVGEKMTLTIRASSLEKPEIHSIVLLPNQKWNNQDARAAALKLRLSGVLLDYSLIILCGRKVAAAMGYADLPFSEQEVFSSGQMIMVLRAT